MKICESLTIAFKPLTLKPVTTKPGVSIECCDNLSLTNATHGRLPFFLNCSEVVVACRAIKGLLFCNPSYQIMMMFNILLPPPQLPSPWVLLAIRLMATSVGELSWRHFSPSVSRIYLNVFSFPFFFINFSIFLLVSPIHLPQSIIQSDHPATVTLTWVTIPTSCQVPFLWLCFCSCCRQYLITTWPDSSFKILFKTDLKFNFLTWNLTFPFLWRCCCWRFCHCQYLITTQPTSI